MEAYSNNKAIYHPLNILKLRNNEQPYPVHVQLIISDFCNQNCNFCAYRTEGYQSNELFKIYNNGVINNNPRRMIPLSKLNEIIADCKTMGVKAIQITGGGEPTVHPDFDQVISTILDADIDVSVVTNGLLMTEKRAALLSQCSWVRVSIDSACSDTYAKIRRVKQEEFEIVKRNVKRLSNIANRKAYVGIGYTITHDNYREIYDGCKLAKSLGVDNIRISAVFQNDNHKYFEDMESEILDNLNRSEELNDDAFRVFNNFKSRYNDLEQGRPDYHKCHYMHFTTYIGGDQNVYVCCVNSYNERGLIGSIVDKSFKELWDSQLKQDLFNNYDANKCDRCMFNDKNRFIESLVQIPKSHANFV